MDAAVSLHPAPPLSLHHHHRALHLSHPPLSSISTRLAVTLARAPNSSRALPRSSASPSAAASARALATTSVIPAQSTRAATGYAAALADASLRAGTLVRASRHARALLHDPPRGWPRLEEPDLRVAALVRMLAGKGKAAMVTEVMAEFAAICDRLLASSC